MLTDCRNVTGELTISGVSLHTAAWNAFDLSTLWVGPDVRGSDRLLPGATGVRPRPRRGTVTQHVLRMGFVGEVDPTGAPQPDPWVGLEGNLSTFDAGVVVPIGTGDGTRPASLVMPSGDVRTADIHVLTLRLGATIEGRSSDGRRGVAARATLTISIPAGRFE